MRDRALISSISNKVSSVSNKCDACRLLFFYSRMIQSFENTRNKRTLVQLLLLENVILIVIIASDSQHGVSVADKL